MYKLLIVNKTVSEHSIPVDVDKLNREIIEQDYNLWDALESSKWIPCDTLELCY